MLYRTGARVIAFSMPRKPYLLKFRPWCAGWRRLQDHASLRGTDMLLRPYAFNQPLDIEIRVRGQSLFRGTQFRDDFVIHRHLLQVPREHKQMASPTPGGSAWPLFEPVPLDWRCV